ncbi:hypothetical protein FF38_08833 [Lucilia cuprina]|uniref:Uncharacterized protein n=1 Tax=Lucilia cuprina TaxID=7375 RepID=A0A0L0BRP5_LUCCU|nr:hypothetical protein FF38_08833 [Lucilia cuprina]
METCLCNDCKCIVFRREARNTLESKSPPFISTLQFATNHNAPHNEQMKELQNVTHRCRATQMSIAAKDNSHKVSADYAISFAGCSVFTKHLHTISNLISAQNLLCNSCILLYFYSPAHSYQPNLPPQLLTFVVTFSHGLSNLLILEHNYVNCKAGIKRGLIHAYDSGWKHTTVLLERNIKSQHHHHHRCRHHHHSYSRHCHRMIFLHSRDHF